VLVGRKAECAAIDRLLDRARNGSGGALVFRGSPGIGKSALLDYAVANATDCMVSRVTGVESEVALGFAAIHQLVHPFLGHMAGLPEPQRHAMESVFGLADHGPPNPLLVFLAVLTLLDETSREKPLLLVIDDAQWVDGESARVLTFVGRRLDADRIAMLFGLRDTGSASPTVFDELPRLEVAPLSEADEREMLEYVAGPVDPEIAERLIAETQGNPLALLAFIAELSDAQLLGDVPLPEPLPIDRSLQDQFAARALLLPEAAQTVLLLAAAERFGDPALLRRAARSLHAPWEDAVASIEAAGLASIARGVSFRHPLIRSAVYHGAPASDRRRAHRALAEALDGDDDVDRRAWHFAAAATEPDEKIARALALSAGRVLERGGSVAAAEFLQRASELTPDPALRIDRLLAAVRLRAASGNAAQAQRLLDGVSMRSETARVRAEAEWTQGLLWLDDGRARDAMGALQRAVASLEAYDRGLPLDVFVTAEVAALYAASLGDASLAEEVAAKARTSLSGEEASLTPAERLVYGIAVALTEGYVPAAPILRTALEGFGEDVEVSDVAATANVREHEPGLELLAVHAAAALLDDAAGQVVTRSWVAFARRARTLTTLPIALDLMSVFEIFAGRFRAAESAMAEAEAILSFVGSRGHIGDPGLGELFLHAYRGDEDKARDAASRKARDARERGAGIDLDHADYALAVLELGWRRYPAVLEHCRKIELNDPLALSTLAAPMLIEAAVRCDDHETANAAFGRFSERATASGTDWAQGLLSGMRALLASDDEAESHYRTCLDRLSHCTAAVDRARMQLLYGEWLRRSRRRREAREPLREALELFERIEARGFAERARRELVATGEHSRVRSDATRDLLTAQESQIAQLVAEGRTNAEVASNLFITRSTVEYHLHKIYRKLGVRSRTQLARLDLESLSSTVRS
jgi:DNA-binding CsgD family transcriptional regulator